MYVLVLTKKTVWATFWGIFFPQADQATKAWDRCYGFKNIFAEKNCEKIGVFDSKQS
jgi:hypothetical protein